MSKVKNPQQKKALSYEKDRRNAYGESDKGSRKSIRRSKRLEARAERSTQGKLKQLRSHEMDEELALDIESEVNSSHKKKRSGGFRKYPDQSLKDHIAQQKSKRDKRYGRRKHQAID